MSKNPKSEPETTVVDQPAIEKARKVKARVLVDCDLGKCNEVIEVEEKALKSHAGTVDPSPEAVAYAESLNK
jgi:hypothetical protein